MMLTRCGLVPLSLVVLAPLGGPLPVEELKPAVSLVLSKTSAERREQDVLFRCEALLDNATGRGLTVRSNFYSVFDGLELVVTNREGRTLAQQAYTAHQSPFTPHGRGFALRKGATAGALVFPVRGLPGGVKAVKVRLVGTLPGSGWDRILSTETIQLNIKG
jgi:hypothetical protein